MTPFSGARPAIVLVDDDYYSARLLTRMLDAHGGPTVARMPDPHTAADTLVAMAASPPATGRCMAIVDLKRTSTATREFIEILAQHAPGLLVVAMAPSLDRETRDALLAAGASAVFERHADLALYRREAANIIAFWARSQRLDAVGT